MNGSLISAQPPRWASQMFGVQTGLSGRALVIAACINVTVSAQAGAEGLDVVPLGRVIVSDNVLFHLYTTLIASVLAI